ncbi:hypothetical protein [Burkholderia gladioli]|uniref:hypothetical protein n=1 Tax=Burkholderia gladioli TaxID=28095 RepID=UPI00163FF576|nr:hypothetical protein [Burkholderia gladioli]
MSESKQQWTKWEDARPQAAGVYRWRVASRAVAGISVSFLAKMRMRGAGYSDDVLSPEFDYWDGYRVILPKEVEWQHVDITAARVVKGYEDIRVDGIEPSRCPFCKQIPRLAGCQSSWQGTTIGAAPFDYNEWSMSCCSWAKAPRFSDPRELVSAHAKLIGDDSAAPELVEALQAIMEMCDGYVPNTSKAVWNQARAALAKAGAIDQPRAAKPVAEPARHSTICSFCLEPNCNGECLGDGGMGD